MDSLSGKYEVHRVFEGEDRVIGTFEVADKSVSFPTHSDELNCDIIPAGPISSRTEDRIKYLLDNDHKSMYLKKV